MATNYSLTAVGNHITAVLDGYAESVADYSMLPQEAALRADSYLKGIAWALANFDDMEKAADVAVCKMNKLPKLTTVSFRDRKGPKLIGEWTFWKGVQGACREE